MSGVRKFFISVGLIALFLVAGYAAAKVLQHTAPEVVKTEKAIPPQLVETIKLAHQDRIDWFEGYGTVRPDRAATLTAEVGAAVVELVGGLKAGVAVSPGQLLVRLDDRQYQEQLDGANRLAAANQATLEQLAVERSNLEKLVAIAREQADITGAERRRVGNLYQENNAAEAEYNRVRLAHQQSLQNLQTLENQLALIEPRKAGLEASRDARLNEAAIARLNVERCRITAPFAARVEAVMVEVGDSVRLGSPIARIITENRLEIPLEIPVSRRPDMELGAECILTVDSMPDTEWKGLIIRIAPSADERSRTFAAYVEVDNTQQNTALVPGYFVRAQVKGPLLQDVLIVPRGAITDGQVFVARNEKAEIRSVRVDRLLRDQAVVVGDVAPGDRVVVSNLDVLYEGAAIRTDADD